MATTGALLEWPRPSSVSAQERLPPRLLSWSSWSRRPPPHCRPWQLEEAPQEAGDVPARPRRAWSTSPGRPPGRGAPPPIPTRGGRSGASWKIATCRASNLRSGQRAPTAPDAGHRGRGDLSGSGARTPAWPPPFLRHGPRARAYTWWGCARRRLPRPSRRTSWCAPARGCGCPGGRR